MIRLPCSILSLDVQDAMGSHIMNIHGSLLKFPIDKDGKELGSEYIVKFKEKSGSHDAEEAEMPEFESVKNQMIQHNGCRLKGSFSVNKVPGNFHISSHAYGPVIQRLAQEGYFQNYELSHKINHISFGDDAAIKSIKSNFNTGELNPLDKTEKISREKKVYEYYMKVFLKFI